MLPSKIMTRFQANFFSSKIKPDLFIQTGEVVANLFMLMLVIVLHLKRTYIMQQACKQNS